MSYCASCGAVMPTGATFCGSCGHRVGSPVAAAAVVAAAPVALAALPPTVALGPTPTPPPPPSPRRSPVVPVMVVLAVLAIGIGVVVLATRDGKGTTTSATSTTILDGATTTLAGTTTVSSSVPPSSTTPPDPTAQLQQLVAGDLSTAKSLVGKYVPQLSAKKVGLVAGSVTYGPAEILGDHLTLRAAYGAILVDGTVFQFTAGGVRMIGWFLTIVPAAFSTKAGATKWCTDHGLTSADCFGRKFSPPA